MIGRKVKYNDSVEGKLQFENNRWYICTNDSSYDGAVCTNRLGYKYSYMLYERTEEQLRKSPVLVLLDKTLDDIQVGDVVLDGDGDERTLIFRSGNFVVFEDEDGDCSSNYTIKEIARYWWTLPVTEEEKPVVELSIDEIASKFNISVDQLRIKKDE